jgi:hypothetical protein
MLYPRVECRPDGLDTIIEQQTTRKVMLDIVVSLPR